MDYDSRLSALGYQPAGEINKEHGITLVQHTATGKYRVCKKMPVYNLEVFRALKDHHIPGTPYIFDLFEDNNILTIIEEYIPGNTLAEEMERRGAMSDSEVSDLILKLCPILTALHDLTPPIIHRDIKPSNLILTPSGTLFLLDFNAAKYWDPTETEDTVLLGTKGYAAPEQFGFGSSMPQTDIYAIGILINSLLSGETNNSTICSDSALYPVIKKCTELRPVDRYSSVSELESAIRRGTNPVKASLKASTDTIGYRRFLPPGFRHGFTWRILLALPSYALIIFLCFSMEVKDKNGNPVLGGKLYYERTFCFVFIMALILFIFNYLNVQRIIPLPTNRKLIFRIIGVILTCFVIMIVLLVVGFLLEGMLFPAAG